MVNQRLVSIVVPLFNEEENIVVLLERLHTLSSLDIVRWQFVFVNDGSSDGTRAQLLANTGKLPKWKFVQLSRNFGQQAAYRAGLDAADGDAVIFLDADLQDPPELIPQMLECWQQGAKMVTACRKSRAETGYNEAVADSGTI